MGADSGWVRPVQRLLSEAAPQTAYAAFGDQYGTPHPAVKPAMHAAREISRYHA